MVTISVKHKSFSPKTIQEVILGTWLSTAVTLAMVLMLNFEVKSIISNSNRIGIFEPLENVATKYAAVTEGLLAMLECLY